MALTQQPAGFIALCHLCHQVKHVGQTGIIAAKGIVGLDADINCSVSVNDCTYQDYIEHSKAVAEL